MKRFILFTILFSNLFFLSANTIISAKEMQGKNTYLEIDTLKTTNIAAQPSETNTESTNIEQVTFIKSNKNTKSFVFSISPLIIEYGELSPTNPVIRTSILNITNLLNPIYTVFTQEDHRLNSADGNFIPDASCDNGICSAYIAATWENTLSFGFGYSCDRNRQPDCTNSFHTANQFKQFANKERQEDMATVMKGTGSDKDKESTIIYKVNTASSQPAGSYTNTITYTLVPGY